MKFLSTWSIFALAISCLLIAEGKKQECSCGNLGTGENPCTCSEVVVKAAKLSKPTVFVPPEVINEAVGIQTTEKSTIAAITETASGHHHHHHHHKHTHGSSCGCSEKGRITEEVKEITGHGKIAPSFPPIGDVCYPLPIDRSGKIIDTFTKVTPAHPGKIKCSCNKPVPYEYCWKWLKGEVDGNGNIIKEEIVKYDDYKVPSSQSYDNYGISSSGTYGSGYSGYGGYNSGSYGGSNSGAFGGSNVNSFGGSSSGVFGGSNSGVFGGSSSSAFGGSNSGTFGGSSLGSFGQSNLGVFGGSNSGVFGGSSSSIFDESSSGVFGGSSSTLRGGNIKSSSIVYPTSERLDTSISNGCEIDETEVRRIYPNLPADAVSVALAYKSLRPQNVHYKNGRPFVPEDKLSFGHRTVPKDMKQEKKVNEIAEEKLVTVERPVVELQLAPQKTVVIGSYDEREEARLAELEAIERESITKEEVSGQVSESVVSYKDLGYAPVRYLERPKSIGNVMTMDVIAEDRPETPCGPLGPTVPGYIPGSVVVHREIIETEGPPETENVYVQRYTINGDSDEEEDNLSSGFLYKLRNLSRKNGSPSCAY